MELNNNLSDIEDLTYQDLEILDIHSRDGDTLASSLIKSWMNSLSYEDASFGGILGEKVLGHVEKPSLETSKLVTWTQSGEWLCEDGETIEGITHFSELPENFFKDSVNFTMPEVETKLSFRLKVKRLIGNASSLLVKQS
ncbi:hypothetical protein [Vibrio phage Va2]|nr:hypothetical protein [Vibrio phage Va2]